MSDVTHRIEFMPGYDKRTSNPRTNYGVHGMEIRFALIAPLGSIHFTLNTGWVPNITDSDALARPNGASADLFPIGRDVGIHWASPRAVDDRPDNGCDLNASGVCYYDAAFMASDRIGKAFVRDGEDAVWDALDDWYRTLAAEDPIGDAYAAALAVTA